MRGLLLSAMAAAALAGCAFQQPIPEQTEAEAADQKLRQGAGATRVARAKAEVLASAAEAGRGAAASWEVCVMTVTERLARSSDPAETVVNKAFDECAGAEHRLVAQWAVSGDPNLASAYRDEMKTAIADRVLPVILAGQAARHRKKGDGHLR